MLLTMHRDTVVLLYRLSQNVWKNKKVQILKKDIKSDHSEQILEMW